MMAKNGQAGMEGKFDMGTGFFCRIRNAITHSGRKARRGCAACSRKKMRAIAKNTNCQDKKQSMGKENPRARRPPWDSHIYSDISFLANSISFPLRNRLD